MPLTKQDHQPSLRHTSGQHVHHLLGFREMAKRSKEEHGGDPNATGKRLIRAAEYCDQKSDSKHAIITTFFIDDGLMPELSCRKRH